MKRFIRSFLAAARGVPAHETHGTADEERDRKLISESGLFDADFYVKNYPDVLAAHVNPLDHYIRNGRKEGRQPSALFNPRGYLLANPDLDPTITEPLMHYISSGKAEGRLDRFTSSVTSTAGAKMRSFLYSDREFVWSRDSKAKDPIVSVVLVSNQSAEAILPCLEALQLDAVSSQVRYEVIVIDDGSRDETPLILRRLVGIETIANSKSVGFAAAANQAAQLARGQYLLFIQNGTIPEQGSIEAALSTMKGQVGIIGGKIVSSQGRLMEAGGAIFPDGSIKAFTNSGDLFSPDVLFLREVLFCSSDFLLTPRAKLLEVGGFDPDPGLAGFAEADYALRLSSLGLKAIYDPRVTVFRHGNAAKDERLKELRKSNRPAFYQKHKQTLDRLQPIADNSRKMLFQAAAPGNRLLYVDDRVPLSHLGAGFPRTKQLIEVLVAQKFQVSFVPLSERDPDPAEIRSALPIEVEVLSLPERGSLVQLLTAQAADYDVMVVSRIHNLSETLAVLNQIKKKPRLIYDAEAIFADRCLAQAELKESEPMKQAALLSRTQEFEDAQKADLILSVSKSEMQEFSEATKKPVLQLGTYFDVSASERPFNQRNGFLLLASYHGAGTPNHDGLSWFLKQVWPLIDKLEMGPLRIVGYRAPGVEMPAMPPNVQFIGHVDELAPFFDESRVFIAPTRFASGIPLKCVEAASYGLPMVITSVLSRNLAWEAGQDHLATSHKDPGLFARECARLYREPDLWNAIRKHALQRVQTQYSRAVFEAQVQEAFQPGVVRGK